MKTESKAKGRIVRMKLEDIPMPTPERLAELHRISEEIEPDLSDIPEQTFEDLIYRDAAGDFPGRSFLRDAVVAAMEKTGLDGVQAPQGGEGFHRPTLSVSATNEFVKGQTERRHPLRRGDDEGARDRPRRREEARASDGSENLKSANPSRPTSRVDGSSAKPAYPPAARLSRPHLDRSPSWMEVSR